MSSYILTRDFSRQAVTLFRTSGLLSIAGSSVILFIILSDRRNKLQRIHCRLLVGICCTDLLHSVALCISTAAIPRDTPDFYNIYGNVGTVATCKAQGFFIQWGMLGLPFYMASLSLYFLLVIRYKMKDEDISRRIEPMMHCVSALIPFSVAITGLGLNLYHNKLVMCWIESEPWLCTYVKGLECTAAKHAATYELWFSLVWIFAAIIFEVFAMCLIYFSVKRQEKAMNAFALRSSRNGRVLSSSSTRVLSDTRDSAIQSFLYIFGFLLTYVWPFGSYIMARVGWRPPRGYYLSAFFFSPLLGFWNFVAYIRPRYARISRENVDKSFFWKFKAVFFPSNTERRQTQRRNMIRDTTRRATMAQTENIAQGKRKSNILPKALSLVALGPKPRNTLDLPVSTAHQTPVSDDELVPGPQRSDRSSSLAIDNASLEHATCPCVKQNIVPESSKLYLINNAVEGTEQDDKCKANFVSRRRMSVADIIASDFNDEDFEPATEQL